MNPCWRCGYQFRDAEDRSLHDCVGDAKLSEAVARWRSLAKAIPPSWAAVIIIFVWTTAIGFHVIGGSYAEQEAGLHDYYSRQTTTWSTGKLNGLNGTEAQTVDNDWSPSWVQLHLGGFLTGWGIWAVLFSTLYYGARVVAMKLPPRNRSPPWLLSMLQVFVPLWAVLLGLVIAAFAYLAAT